MSLVEEIGRSPSRHVPQWSRDLWHTGRVSQVRENPEECWDLAWDTLMRTCAGPGIAMTTPREATRRSRECKGPGMPSQEQANRSWIQPLGRALLWSLGTSPSEWIYLKCCNPADGHKSVTICTPDPQGRMVGTPVGAKSVLQGGVCAIQQWPMPPLRWGSCRERLQCRPQTAGRAQTFLLAADPPAEGAPQRKTSCNQWLTCRNW